MKVLAVVPYQTFMFAGGLRTQVERTVQELINLGCEVEFWNGREEITKKRYDLAHIFSMNAPTYFQAIALKNYGLPLVFSSVMWRSGSRSIIRMVNAVLEKTPFFLLTDTLACKHLSKLATLILPNTQAELDWLATTCNVDTEKCIVIPNAADDRFSQYDLTKVDLSHLPQKFLLSISIINKRKNILRLAKCARELGYPLIHIGGTLDHSYAEQLRMFDNVTLLGQMSNEDPVMGAMIRRSQVFALVSEYETPGIAALEAGLQGANCVLTSIGGTNEYFGDLARYVDPFNERSIRAALQSAWNNPLGGQELIDTIRKNYNWKIVAEKTLAAYNSVL